MATDHRGRPVGDLRSSHGGHKSRPMTFAVGSKPNRFVRPVATSSGAPFPKAYTTTGEVMDNWNADLAAKEDFDRYERTKGTVKPMKGSDRFTYSIDEVGPYKSPTLYSNVTGNTFQSTVGHWTNWGARRLARKLAQAQIPADQRYY